MKNEIQGKIFLLNNFALTMMPPGHWTENLHSLSLNSHRQDIQAHRRSKKEKFITRQTSYSTSHLSLKINPQPRITSYQRNLMSALSNNSAQWSFTTSPRICYALCLTCSSLRSYSLIRSSLSLSASCIFYFGICHSWVPLISPCSYEDWMLNPCAVPTLRPATRKQARH